MLRKTGDICALTETAEREREKEGRVMRGLGKIATAIERERERGWNNTNRKGI